MAVATRPVNGKSGARALTPGMAGIHDRQLGQPILRNAANFVEKDARAGRVISGLGDIDPGGPDAVG